MCTEGLVNPLIDYILCIEGRVNPLIDYILYIEGLVNRLIDYILCIEGLVNRLMTQREALIQDGLSYFNSSSRHPSPTSTIR